MYRDHVGHYRCSKFRLKCYVKLRVDEKMKFAHEKGTHSHDQTTLKIPAEREIIENSSKPKSASTGVANCDDFSKDVTADVELITNDRNVTLMFLKGFKFTKYFDNKVFNRFERSPW